MSTRFVRDAIMLMAAGGLMQLDGAALAGVPIDLSKVTCDNFVVAAQTDHITTWRPYYRTSQLFGGSSEMVVTNKGHVQTVVSPVANSRQKFAGGPADVADPDAWIAGAEQHDGSWWSHWSAWLTERAGAEKPPPDRLGSRKYPERDLASGRYVLGK